MNVYTLRSTCYTTTQKSKMSPSAIDASVASSDCHIIRSVCKNKTSVEHRINHRLTIIMWSELRHAAKQIEHLSLCLSAVSTGEVNVYETPSSSLYKHLLRLPQCALSQKRRRKKEHTILCLLYRQGRKGCMFGRMLYYIFHRDRSM